jgi:hypothetical protein
VNDHVGISGGGNGGYRSTNVWIFLDSFYRRMGTYELRVHSKDLNNDGRSIPNVSLSSLLMILSTSVTMTVSTR